MTATASQTTVQFPDVLRPTDILFHPQLASKSGGVSVTGLEQVIISSAGRWYAKATFSIGWRHTTRNEQDLVLAFRAMLARNQGRSNNFLIGPYDEQNTPAAIDETSFGGVSQFGDGADFDDGTDFDQSETPAVVYNPGAIGDVLLDIVMQADHVPEPGQYFSIGERMYLISTVEPSQSSPDLSSNTYSIGFWPSLRDAVSAGDTVDFDNPRCRMRFMADTDGQLSMEQMYEGQPVMEMVEAP